MKPRKPLYSRCPKCTSPDIQVIDGGKDWVLWYCVECHTFF